MARGARCPDCDVYQDVRGGRRMCPCCGQVFLRPSEAVQWLMDNLGAVVVEDHAPVVPNGRVPAVSGQEALF